VPAAIPCKEPTTRDPLRVSRLVSNSPIPTPTGQDMANITPEIADLTVPKGLWDKVSPRLKDITILWRIRAPVI